jgi:uncharacterized protein DUF4160/short subunit dehydrogenase
MGSSEANDLLSPAGRRVIITGARGGIGRATVELLESARCNVAGCDLEDFDLRDHEAVDAGVGSLVEELGGCDSVVANAGVVDTIHRAEQFPEADWQKDLETNLTGQFHLVRAAFEPLRVPRISTFYGIVIWMYHDERHHLGRPHFHATYADDEASIDIEDLEVIAGQLPPNARRLVIEWAREHQAELRELGPRPPPLAASADRAAPLRAVPSMQCAVPRS